MFAQTNEPIDTKQFAGAEWKQIISDRTYEFYWVASRHFEGPIDHMARRRCFFYFFFRRFFYLWLFCVHGASTHATWWRRQIIALVKNSVKLNRISVLFFSFDSYASTFIVCVLCTQLCFAARPRTCTVAISCYTHTPCDAWCIGPNKYFIRFVFRFIFRFRLLDQWRKQNNDLLF